MAFSAISRKARKQNFSASEIAVLTEKVEENLSLIQSKFTNSVINQKKNKMWKKSLMLLSLLTLLVWQCGQQPKLARSGETCSGWQNLREIKT